MASAMPNPTDCCNTCDCADTQTATTLVQAIRDNHAFQNRTALRAATIHINYMVVDLLGTTTAGDGGDYRYFFDPTSSAVDNGTTIIKPNDVAAASAGRWLAL